MKERLSLLEMLDERGTYDESVYSYYKKCKRNYHKASLKWHEDKCPNKDLLTFYKKRMQAINAAWETIKAEKAW